MLTAAADTISPIQSSLAFARGPDDRSPAEQAFFESARHRLPGLVCQYSIGHYLADFAIPELSIVLEIDGRDYHSFVEQRDRDYKRERQFQCLGWTVIRFTGAEVMRAPEQCIADVVTIAGLIERHGRMWR